MTEKRAASAPPSAVCTLRWFALLCAGMSLAALLVHVAGFLPMSFFLVLFGVPSVFLLFALAAIARWLRAEIVLDGMRTGLLAGALATVVYDGVRSVVSAHTYLATTVLHRS